MSGTRRRVVVVQRRLTHYRVPFFTSLRADLAQRGVDLELLVGHGTEQEAAKRDAGTLPWARSVPTYYAAGGKLCWQTLSPHLQGADLVIVAQENKLLHNLPLLLNGRRRFKLAFWGHGGNLQSNQPNGLKENIKRWTARKVDWWFAYTSISEEMVAATGFPRERISIVNNAVDTLELESYARSITPAEMAALRRELDLQSGPVGVFIGSLYSDKRLDFLFKAAHAIRTEIPDFQLLIIGDGPEGEAVRRWCVKHAWSHWLGARQGREKVKCLMLGDIMLSPGAIGLGVLDSFALRLPVVVTRGGNHGPEVAYLKDGVNGRICPQDLDAYRNACIFLLKNAGELDRLRDGCGRSASVYTAKNMIDRFTHGICASLNAPPYRQA